MEISKTCLTLNGKPLSFFHPLNDSCCNGTIAGLQKNEFDINKVKFQENDIFIDIGCNVGLVSMVFATVFPFIKVYSFDANPVAIKCLELSIAENNIKNITAYNLAIGAENKKDIKFVTFDEQQSCLIQKEHSPDDRNKTYSCDMINLADFFDQNNIEKVKCLKIDIETGEFAVFDYLFANRPDILDKIEYLICEIHPLDDSVPRSKDLKEKLKNKFGANLKLS
jgi:FkbM family methyltransferase